MKKRKSSAGEKARLNVRIDFPSIQLTLTNARPERLRDINSLMTSIKTFESFGYEDNEMDVFKFSFLSEELLRNRKAVKFLNTASKVENKMVYRKLSLRNVSILDFDSKEYTSCIETNIAKKRIKTLCSGMENANFALVHVLGKIPKSEKNALIDIFQAVISTTKIKTVFTQKDMLGKTMIETVFFGDLEENNF